MIAPIEPVAGKKKTTRINSRSEAESVMELLAVNANNRRRLIAEMDAKRLALEQKYQPAIEDAEIAMEKCEMALEAWAEANPGEFPIKKKSIKLVAGTIGYRDGQPKLELVSKTWTWDRALEAVQSFLPNFIRNKPEIDKEAIIAQCEELELSLRSCGLKVNQGERFFAKPKLTELEEPA